MEKCRLGGIRLKIFIEDLYHELSIEEIEKLRSEEDIKININGMSFIGKITYFKVDYERKRYPLPYLAKIRIETEG